MDLKEYEKKCRLSDLRKQEIDPYDMSPSDKGAKLDAGKVKMNLVLGGFSNALMEVGKVGTFGAKKYTEGGWLEVPCGIARYSDAMLRHHFQEMAGEFDCEDSGISHAAHTAWNALARLELMLKNGS
jgi:hypothetical protein